ncbi:GtrA family protein [Roseateles sp.]|uniref:GtrA family protein n=1 Tax=Roseateles sp. TaxID=1971397 RepID=UPI003BA93614
MQFLRYALTGGLATAAHYLVLFALVEGLHAAAPAAAMAGALCGALVAYAGNRHFTFGGSPASHRRALPRFATVALLGAALNGAIVWLGSVALGLHYLLAQVIATLTVLVIGFRLNRTWSFS